MASSARIDEIKKKFDENPRRYFAPLANEWRKAGDLEQAILICEEFLPQQAGHMSGHIVYGQALFEAGRLPEARTVFETALGLDPENLIALRHLGDIARAQGEPEEARRWYDRVLEADPRNDEIQALLQSLDADGGAAPAGATTPAGPPGLAAEDRALATHSPDPAGRPELAPIDLDLDDAGFATVPAATPVASTPPPLPQSMAMPGLEPTHADAAAAAGVPDGRHMRAEGLEPSEFEVPAAPLPRAEGLEPAEFEVPVTAPARAEGLETTEFEAPGADSTDGELLDLEGSFAAETGAAASPAGVSGDVLPGLEEAGATPPDRPDVPALPSLDLDDGFTVAPHGDAVTHPGAGSATSHAPGGGDPRLEPPAAMEAMPALQLDAGAPAPAGALPDDRSMLELPPAVIAAESALMDAPDGYGFADHAPPAAAQGTAGRAPFVTETMAELYEKQGFTAQALDVYRQLADASPHDARLRDRVRALEAGAVASGHAAPGAPTVREFLFHLATRRPNERGAQAEPPSASDFSSFDAIPEVPGSAAARVEAADRAEQVATDSDAGSAAWNAPSTPTPAVGAPAVPAAVRPASVTPTPASASAAIAMPSSAERGAAAQGGPAAAGTIDALFGGRAASTSADSAAAALAQAFGGTSDAPVISGRAAHAASGELSLDSVFRDGPARPPRISQGFAFDQFFSEGAADTAAPAPPVAEAPPAGEAAERGADEVKQFNSWLQGLKPR